MISEERLNSIVKKVACNFNFKTWSYNGKHLNESIENYFGVLVPVTINGNTDNGEETKHVIIKIAPEEKRDDMKAVVRQHYEVEVYTYCTLLPTYRNITTVNENFIPECYYSSLNKSNEVIVLQDMTYNGYRRHERDNLLDLEHVVISLKALAKFHSLSIVYKENGYKFDVDIMKPYIRFHSQLEIYFTYIKNALHRHWNMDVFKDTKHQDYIKRLVDNYDSYVNSATFEASYLIYGHGDFWRENILFKYEEGKPVAACVIDFQKSRTMSPAQDILLFLLGNIESEQRRKHMQYFLEVYLDQLHSILSENGLNAVYNMNNLVGDLRVVAPISIAISFMGYSLWFGLEDNEVFKSKNTCNNDQTLLRFKTKVIDLLDDLTQMGYITV